MQFLFFFGCFFLFLPLFVVRVFTNWFNLELECRLKGMSGREEVRVQYKRSRLSFALVILFINVFLCSFWWKKCVLSFFYYFFLDFLGVGVFKKQIRNIQQNDVWLVPHLPSSHLSVQAAVRRMLRHLECIDWIFELARYFFYFMIFLLFLFCGGSGDGGRARTSWRAQCRPQIELKFAFLVFSSFAMFFLGHFSFLPIHEM